MRSSAIYNKIVCNCKSDRSFGCPSAMMQTICVGASQTNSYEALDIEALDIGVQRVDSEDERTFFITVDRELLKTVTYNTKTKKFKEEHNAKITTTRQLEESVNS